ncbi:MAG: helix-turn-helix domain-containing protein [Planctomycetes bacterium]|nr:helix-turn-helix domain-containing protein [Planctomycetota bacterium]
MPQTRTPGNRTKTPKKGQTRASVQTGAEVLTLAEAAAFLRVAEEQLGELAAQQEIPGRQIGGEWRFLRLALANWLATPARKGFWDTQFGALKGDPYLDEMLREIYQQRGRPMTEDG